MIVQCFVEPCTSALQWCQMLGLQCFLSARRGRRCLIVIWSKVEKVANCLRERAVQCNTPALLACVCLVLGAPHQCRHCVWDCRDFLWYRGIAEHSILNRSSRRAFKLRTDWEIRRVVMPGTAQHPRPCITEKCLCSTILPPPRAPKSISASAPRASCLLPH